jgi:signal transduction histidine kinase
VRTDLEVNPSEATHLARIIERYLEIIVDAQGGDCFERASRESLGDIAREHALSRIRMGFDIDHLVRELSLFRRTVLQVLREDGVEVTPEAAETIARGTELAMAASIKSYVDAREGEVRKEQAEQVGFVAHELRGPLAAAAMSTEVLHRMGVPSEQHERMLDRIRRNFQRATYLTDELLQAGRLESGSFAHQLSETTIGAIIDELVDSARQAAEAKGCELTASYDPNARVVADVGLTRKAVECLLDNAVKYTDRGAIRLVVDESSTAISVHVRDSCPGIPEEELPRVFESFQRGRNGKPGTGLGLSLARRAVEAQGGTICAESRNGGGCHFWFTLPKRNVS